MWLGQLAVPWQGLPGIRCSFPPRRPTVCLTLVHLTFNLQMSMWFLFYSFGTNQTDSTWMCNYFSFSGFPISNLWSLQSHLCVFKIKQSPRGQRENNPVMELKSTMASAGWTAGSRVSEAQHQALSLEGHVWWLILCRSDWAQLFAHTRLRCICESGFGWDRHRNQ